MTGVARAGRAGWLRRFIFGAAIGLLAFVGGGLLWIGVPLPRYKRKPEEDKGSES